MLVLATVLCAWSTAHAQSIFCSLKRCDDGDPCTVDSCRGLGMCVFEPVRCDDGDACTLDRCDATGTCRFTSVGACDDQNPCTDDRCVDGACQNMPLEGIACGASAFCAGRTCTCVEPFLDCDDLPGCEVDPMVDDAHCGRCDRECSGATCIMGTCRACRSDPDCPAEDGRTCTTTVSCVDGRCVYERRRGSGNVSIDAPIQRFEGDNFVVGLGPIATTFIVSKPPRLADGKWTMTVDGVELTRTSSPGQVRT